jgi:17beta-estradiol 17-dehydrogenase / very-long-chain 3-oxoacyl-CoA reductase
MTKLLLPKMLEKKNGLIVNISSSSSILIPPMLMCYGATKVHVMLAVAELDNIYARRKFNNYYLFWS